MNCPIYHILYSLEAFCVDMLVYAGVRSQNIGIAGPNVRPSQRGKA